MLVFQANQLNQLGYDIFILGHKRNAVNPSRINFTTPGIAKEFVKDYPKLFEGWKTYCSSKSRGVSCYCVLTTYHTTNLYKDTLHFCICNLAQYIPYLLASQGMYHMHIHLIKNH